MESIIFLLFYMSIFLLHILKNCNIFWLHSVNLYQNFILVVLHDFFVIQFCQKH